MAKLKQPWGSSMNTVLAQIQAAERPRQETHDRLLKEGYAYDGMDGYYKEDPVMDNITENESPVAPLDPGDSAVYVLLDETTTKVKTWITISWKNPRPVQAALDMTKLRRKTNPNLKLYIKVAKQ